MHFDYVDIGTCDFDTSFDHSSNPQDYNFLFVDPLDFYLDHYKNHSNVTLECAAISNRTGTCTVYYVPGEICEKHNLPWYIKGCSSIDKKHSTVERVLREMDLDPNLIHSKTVNVITFDMLCNKHNITSINYLKIDTEGHEEFIMPDVLTSIKNGMKITTIRFENQAVLGNKVFLDNLLLKFYDIGYRLVGKSEMDVIIEK
jgi:FkbM family methyltransferase